MIKAQLITIGTEITSGEVVNSNAAWISTQLEERGVRVFSHLTIRDQTDEILKALSTSVDYAVVVVTGGLGPTSDDITRACLAQYAQVKLEFDAQIWAGLEDFYRERGLPLREAHRHQCFFPQGSERLLNPVGTALGFAMAFQGRSYFILPGPPRELEGMWHQEVAPRLALVLPRNPFHWVRWTCLGTPESEVAELVEKVIAGTGIEVGYRAHVPYVKVKVYVNREDTAQMQIANKVAEVLAPFLVSQDGVDLAEEFMLNWPEAELNLVDEVTDFHLSNRLFAAQLICKKAPRLNLQQRQTGHDDKVVHLRVHLRGEQFVTTCHSPQLNFEEVNTLPYKVNVSTERGKRSAAEWVLWNCVKKLRATRCQS